MYIREAHPIDGERPGSRILVEQPITNLERQTVATTCLANLDLGGIPALLDGIDDSTSHAYAAHPDRLYLVGQDGNIAFAGAQGPRGFHPEELEVAILYELGRGSEVADRDSPPVQDRGARSGGFRPGGAGGPGGGFRPGGSGVGPGGTNLLSRLPLMTALDVDQDGEISAEEIENAVAALKGLDEDENGKLTADEVMPSFGGRGSSGQGPGRPGGFGGDRGGPGGGRGGFPGGRGSGADGGGRPARPESEE